MLDLHINAHFLREVATKVGKMLNYLHSLSLNGNLWRRVTFMAWGRLIEHFGLLNVEREAEN